MLLDSCFTADGGGGGVGWWQKGTFDKLGGGGGAMSFVSNLSKSRKEQGAGLLQLKLEVAGIKNIHHANRRRLIYMQCLKRERDGVENITV